MAEQIKEVAKFGAEFIPGVGEAMAVKRVSDALDEKDYVSAGIETAAGALGLIPVVGDMAGKALRATTKTLRKDAKLRVDNPGYDEVYQRTYAEIKQESADEAKEKALKRGETDTYASNIGNEGGVTGFANKVKFKPEELKDLPGTMGEEKFRSSGEKLQRLKKDIKEKGYKEQPIMIHVREDGKPFIVEGNHRLAEALESGRDTITANIRYLRGAEEQSGLLDPRNIFPDKMNMAEGGVPMKKQMELFDDGGLKDEGGTIDPISGNDVPTGSMQNEVRDDIPAQLSEGEFVFPADVVRYIGLEKLMQMRQEAKMGLSMMDKMGQMGNSDEAVIPDNIPFELSDLDMDDDPVEMQQGGVAGVSTVPSQVPATSFVQAPPPATTMPIPPTPAPVPTAPTYTPATQQEVPTFTPEQMQNVSFPGVVQTPESAPQLVEIVNPTTGERKTITYIPGVTQLPEGFVLASEYDGSAQATSVTPVVGQAQVRDSGDDSSDRRKDEAAREKMKLDNARLKMTQELFPFTKPADPFSVSTALGKLEPGTRTATGYIIGDNGEYLDPLTGEQAFFGFESAKYALSPEDKPELKIKPGGINEKFVQKMIEQERAGRDRLDKAMIDRQIARQTSLAGQKEAAKKTFDAQRSAKTAQEVAKAREKKQDKKDRDKRIKELEKETKQMTAYEGGIKKGGLLTKTKPKPKKMRSGGLASK